MPMLPIPDTVLTRFDAVLDKRAVAPGLGADFKKWLRYFLDFCSKYPVPDIRSDQVRLFMGKLREKRQTKAQDGEKGVQEIENYFFILGIGNQGKIGEFMNSWTDPLFPPYRMSPFFLHLMKSPGMFQPSLGYFL